jgi:hypothetical protein
MLNLHRLTEWVEFGLALPAAESLAKAFKAQSIFSSAFRADEQYPALIGFNGVHVRKKRALYN